MRNMLAFLAAVVLAVGGLGWYLDWYKVVSHPTDLSGHRNISVDFNVPKISTDVREGVQKGEQWLDNKAANNQTMAAGKEDKAAVKGPALPNP